MKKSAETIQEYIKTYQQLYDVNNNNTEVLLLLGLCDVYLKEFDLAREIFEKSIVLSIGIIPEKKRFYKPWYVLFSCLFSGRQNLLPSIRKIFVLYQKEEYVGFAPLAIFCYILIELIEPLGNQIDTWINDLIAYERKKKCEDISSWGYCFRAIRVEDVQQFHSYMDIILSKHHNTVRFGSLRETAEGFYCIEGMMLCFCALYRGMEVSIESEYISMDYLGFILDKIRKGKKGQ